jgi:hypothetical protein
VLPDDAKARKRIPITTGVLDYFPDALAAVAEVSRIGNEQHNPGEPLHWAKEKSIDHANCIGRHLIGRGSVDTDGGRHSAKLAWRALALLQIELDAEAALANDDTEAMKQVLAHGVEEPLRSQILDALAEQAVTSVDPGQKLRARSAPLR